MIEKIEDVIKIEVSKFRFSANIYLTDDILIDTGFPRTAGKLLNYLKNKKVSKIVNTHGHIDHIGGNSVIQKYFRCKIYLYPIERKYTTLERIIFGAPEEFSSENVPEKIKTEKHSFNVLYTPGHSKDHITLFENKERLAFSGDLVLHGEAREVSNEVEIYRAIDSLKKLKSLKPEKIFPGHGDVFYGYEVLDEKINYLENLGEKIIKLHEEGKNIKEIVKIIFGGERFPYIFIKNYFSAENLVRSYLGNRILKSNNSYNYEEKDFKD